MPRRRADQPVGERLTRASRPGAYDRFPRRGIPYARDQGRPLSVRRPSADRPPTIPLTSQTLCSLFRWSSKLGRLGSFYNFLIAWEYKRAVPVRPSLRAASDGLERD